jgi:2-keto-4-pentenoate hydratase
MKPMLLLLVFAFVQLSRADAISPETLRTIADHYLAKEPIPTLQKGFSMEEALKTQAAFVDLLKPKLGPIAGYKIGLITKQGQERMGASGPVRGVLLKRMLLRDNAQVSAHYGIKPGLELDMGVIVKDDKSNDAKTVDEVIPHLSDLVCFIELVDTITATNQPMDAALLTALNVGARAGVLGGKAKMTPALAKALPEMRMFLTDETGKIVADVPKLNLQPLDNLPWLITELKNAAMRLKAGDFISVGSPSMVQPVAAGKKIMLHYEIPGARAITATVTFTE